MKMSQHPFDMSEMHRKKIKKLKTDKKIYEYLQKENLWSINVILTYKIQEQEIFDIVIPKIPGDKEFMTYIFSILDYVEDIEDLIKISTCMNYVLYEEYPEFLKIRNGKYYFNTDVNKDSDTAANNDFKNSYIKDLKELIN
jgi:hypothetical protein